MSLFIKQARELYISTFSAANLKKYSEEDINIQLEGSARIDEYYKSVFILLSKAVLSGEYIFDPNYRKALDAFEADIAMEIGNIDTYFTQRFSDLSLGLKCILKHYVGFLINIEDKIKEHEGIIRAITDLTIMIAILTFVGVGFAQYSVGNISFTWMLVGIVIIASSFGPVVALSNLSNTLLQTFACAERLFDLIDEEPHVEEVADGHEIKGESIAYDNVTFSYPNRKEKIFDTASVDIKKGDKIALIGESGIGKSTFVKLMMRFWDVNDGKINLDNKNIKEVNTTSLRNSQTLVSQETYLFNESILDNIKIGNPKASKEEVIKAAKMASIHDFIETLPKGYDTKVGELGGNLSSGEKQRIGLARAFLSNGDVLILDEPTSNLDTLNEGEILKSIKENCEDKTIVLISHRKSTTAVCNKTYKLENSKLVVS